MPRNGPAFSLGGPAALFPSRTQVPAGVLREQIRTIHGRLPPGLAVSILVSIALGWVVTTPATERAQILWVTASIFVSVLRYVDCRVHRAPAPDQLSRARLWLQMGAALQGVLWGIAGTFLLPPSAVAQLFLIAVVTGMSAGAVAILSPLWSTYALFMVPTLMPLSFRLMGGALPTQKLIGVLGVVYGITMLYMADRSSRLLKSFLLADQENADLTLHLRQANETLAESHALLEAAVAARTLELSQTNALLLKEIAAKEAGLVRVEAREKALQEAKQRLELATVSGNLGIWDRNLVDGTVIWNERMFEMYGLDPRSCVPSHLLWAREVLHPDDIAASEGATQAAIAGQARYEMEFRIVRPGGEIRFIRSDAQVLRDAEGRAVRIIGVNRDRTREVEAEAGQRRLQAELQHAEKLESLGRLAGGVAHDMNNVLAAILALASANQETQPPGSPAHGAFRTITQAAVRGGKMVKSLLSFARQHPAEERELDLNAILGEEVSLLERTTLSRVRLELDLAPGLRPIRGDAVALTNAFMNLWVNAVDAMPDQGRILLRTRNLEDGRVEVLIQDTGCGMTPSVLERAQDPFFTTKEEGKGTGLGLSMVYSTVKAHRGQVEIWSEPERGTSVRMLFPASAPAAPAAPPAAGPTAKPERSALSVLVVDDDDLVLRSTQALLGIMGHAVTAAASGEEALAAVQGGLRPDLVILDLNMPGLGGAGTLPRLRAALPATPVLLATGRVDQTALDLVKAYPHVALLSKPFSMDDLLAHIK
jgi:signal transduction histidine kinase